MLTPFLLKVNTNLFAHQDIKQDSLLGDDTSGLCSFGKTQEVPGGDDRWSLTGSQQHDDRLGAAMAGHAGAQRSEQKTWGDLQANQLST